MRAFTIAMASALVLSTCALFPKVGVAQYTDAQCASLYNQITQAMNARSFKKLIPLMRENLQFCKEYKRRDEYVEDLSILALALNSDEQHGEALAVANRCLAVNANDLSCLFEKADALYHLGRFSEAKSITERSRSVAAVTLLDEASKRNLQTLNLRLSALTNRELPSQQPSNRNPSSRADVPLKKEGGTFVVPVQINGALT